MQVHYSLDHLPVIPRPVVTVGSFDGVHVGHRVIIDRLNVLASEVAGSSVLISFHPHPRKVLYPDTAGKDLNMINSQAEKIRLMEDTGLDHLIIIKFTLDFARISSESFVRDQLVNRLHAHTIVVGFNHYFGYNREGNFDSLYQLRQAFGFEVEEIPEQEIQHETVSSTKIRKALAEGNIQRANAYLEHHFLILTEMQQDHTKTKDLGHPCYVIGKQDPEKLVPPRGSYAVSLSTVQVNRKGFVRIGEEGMLFFPLESDGEKGIFKGEIRFHKRIAPDGVLNLQTMLDEVRELIY